MELRELKRHWDAWGRQDPLWAVLTWPGKRQRWDPAEFFRTGREELEKVLAYAEGLHWQVPRRRALDFGCGVGRVTQAMTEHFARCDGVDIAPSMLERAAKYNRHPDRCHYHLNDRDDLSLFEDESFDLIYSAHVLQHMEPRYSRRYVQEFVRLLAPGGLAVFQMCTERVVGQTEPLPAEAFHARIEVGTKRVRLEPGAHGIVAVRVTNLSPHVWRAAGKDGWLMVDLGSRWLNRDGEVASEEDRRTRLPDDIPPGESAELDLEIVAPPEPDHYLVEVDLVQEGVGWFGSHGSETARVPARVQRTRILRPRAQIDHADEELVMEMHGVLPEEVQRWVEDSGGRVVDVSPWSVIGNTGKDWHRHFYAISRN